MKYKRMNKMGTKHENITTTEAETNNNGNDKKKTTSKNKKDKQTLHNLYRIEVGGGITFGKYLRFLRNINATLPIVFL